MRGRRGETLEERQDRRVRVLRALQKAGGWIPVAWYPMADVVARAIEGEPKKQSNNSYPSGLQLVRCTFRLNSPMCGGHPYERNTSAAP